MRAVQSLLEKFFFSAALFSGLITAAIFLLMLVLGLPLIHDGRLVSLFMGNWRPEAGEYGVFPMLRTSFSVGFLSLMISVPISLGTSFLATCIGPAPVRKILLGLVRFMAAIPTVIYGFVAIFLLVPFMREYVSGGTGLNILTASFVLALLIAPTMIVFFVNAMMNVPIVYTTAVDALGGSTSQKLLYVLLPTAWPGILTGIVMGLGRAMGDTLISLMVAGNAVASPESIIDSGRTLTAHIALVIAADFAGMEFKSIYACGAILCFLTLIFVILLRFSNTLAAGRIR